MQRAIVIIALIVAVMCGPVGAQAPPHPVILAPVTYSDMTTVVLAVDMSFQAWISSRLAEVLSESSPGSAAADGFLQLDLAAFPTAWAVGDTLAVHVHGAGSNYAQPEDREFIGVLTATAVAWLSALGPNGEFFLPVELSSFSAVPQEGSVLITWVTSSEADNAGFNVLRASGDSGIYRRINPSFFPGWGTCTERHEYSFRDDGLQPGTYSYLLESVATDGSTVRFGPVRAMIGPTAVTLAVGPNPVRHAATIAFSLPQEGRVSISIHDLAGRIVWSLPPRVFPAGSYSLAWDGRDASGSSVPDGAYVCCAAGHMGTASSMVAVVR